MSLFIALTGHNGSGKTKLATELAKNLPLNRITSDDFIAFIKEKIAYFEDLDTSYKNDKYDLVAPLKSSYRTELSRILLESGQHVLHDSGGYKKEHRAHFFANAKKTAGIKTVLIWLDTPEELTLKRLAERDELGITRWVQQYNDKGTFDAPTNDEADVVLRYDQTNYLEIEAALKGMLGN